MCHCQKLGRWPLRDDSTGSFTWNKTGAYGSKQKWSSVCIKYNPWIGIEISLCLESHWANPKRWMDGSHYFDNHALPTQLCSSSFPFTSSWIFRKIAPQIWNTWGLHTSITIPICSMTPCISMVLEYAHQHLPERLHHPVMKVIYQHHGALMAYIDIYI